jgi:dethiobiotin synthetase
MNYFVTAIHTDSGKTLVSAILCEAFKADYWKPIQAGSPTDSDRIRELITNHSIVNPERYKLGKPASPHDAAAAENITISLDDFKLPMTDNDLVIEGAGGCLVPINQKDFVIDIAIKFNCRIVLVSNLYLGSINHTLLTYEALANRNCDVSGIIFNGPENTASENIILHHTKLPCLLKIEHQSEITHNTILQYAKKLNDNWKRIG